MATTDKSNVPKAEYRQLGKSGLRVSVPIFASNISTHCPRGIRFHLCGIEAIVSAIAIDIVVFRGGCMV